MCPQCGQRTMSASAVPKRSVSTLAPFSNEPVLELPRAAVPLVARTAKQDKVRELQRTLYRAAKADPGRRFHALYDKVYRSDVLERAWESVRANKGAAGIDRQTIADVEEYGIAKLLDELAADLKDGSYRPLAARRVFIPKPGRAFHIASATVSPKPSARLFCTTTSARRCNALTIAAFSSTSSIGNATRCTRSATSSGIASYSAIA